MRQSYTGRDDGVQAFDALRGNMDARTEIGAAKPRTFLAYDQ